MQKIGEALFFSASDLTYFAECNHRTWLDRLHLDQPMEKAEDDDTAKLTQQRGFAHEAAFYQRLKADYAHCVEIDTRQSLGQRVQATKEAIQAGAEVIYQGSLRRGNLLGHADFLLRTASSARDGHWTYEVADTKLARSTKAKFILQLCFYSDLLADLTGQLPHRMHVQLGSGCRETFHVADYWFYYRQLLNRFIGYVSAYPEIEPPYPSPCDHCSLCPWRDRCDQRRIADDHLSAVANVTRQQIVRLERASVRTVAQLATLAPDATVPKLVPETLAKLREQAALQVHERETGEQKAVLLPIQQGEIRGFLRLPRPDSGDVFFDMEGDPMEEGGLEYLFGIYYFDEGKPVFSPFWGHDRAQERRAFIDFIDFIMERLEQFPGMHIYHYAHYENTALKRLMSLHGVRESAVDRLLREHKLVDLYKVVREGLRISKPSYSIKAVEAFYMEKRSGEVKKATDSIVVYERWRETGEAALLESIRQYNEDDCRSTWQLREWLLSLRPSSLPWFSDRSEPAFAAATRKPARAKSDKTVQLEEQLGRLQTRLIAETERSGLKRDELELIAALLDFYRRADKPAWWALFDRQEASIDELIEELEVIAGLHSAELWATGDRLDIYRFQYPEQDFKVRAGDYAVRLDNIKEARVRQIDEDACTVDLEMYIKAGEQIPEPLSISIGKPVPSETMRSALFAFANSVLESDGQYKAIRDFLAHCLPDIRGVNPGGAIIDPERPALPQVIAATHGMASSYLFIQGPPGTGKTYTGSHLIASLLQAGKRVAVSSNSHKAINNLLQAVDKRMKDAGATYRGMKKVSTPEQAIDSEFISNIGDELPILNATPPVQLVAGTVWLLAKPAFWQSFDYLFIDEAGQVSLANTIALGMCAKNLILLGDQMQLGQPIQGVHPGRSGESSLEYLLDGEATIAPERGVFLGTTFRMHPDVCRFISDAIYDSRLHSDPSTYQQRLLLDERALPELIETGIKYVPVIHDGCSQRSEEEATVVKGLFENLLTQRYRTGDGEERPIGINDILVVAPYNMQVNLLKKRLPAGARVGTVDKFQGQEAEVVIVSMATSSGEYLPRHLGFLFSKNRLNVAISRARCVALLVCSPALMDTSCGTPQEMALVNTLCWTSDFK